MSLRAELVRFALRRWMKEGGRFGRTIPETRRRMAASERFVPPPPRGFAIRAVEAGGVPAERVTPPAASADRHLLFLHGGGFVGGSPRLYRNLTWRLAAAAEASLLCLDYRLAPEHPFPAALDDAVAGYRFLLETGADPRRIVPIGDSAGGGLVFSLLLRARDQGLPLPGMAVALSPWTDLALSGDSMPTGCRRSSIITSPAPIRAPPTPRLFTATSPACRRA
jgi:monoterpene epsilon-lactone hydrolase